MTDGPALDRAPIIEVLDRHAVEYLVVGGIGAQLHGATRPTADFDSLPSTTEENLGRLAAALQELNAFLRVGGLPDKEFADRPKVTVRPSTSCAAWLPSRTTTIDPLGLWRLGRSEDATPFAGVRRCRIAMMASRC